MLGVYLHQSDRETLAAGSTRKYSEGIEYSHIALASRLVEQSIDTIANTFILYYPRSPGPGHAAWSHPLRPRVALATRTASASSPATRGELWSRRPDPRRSGPRQATLGRSAAFLGAGQSHQALDPGRVHLCRAPTAVNPPVMPPRRATGWGKLARSAGLVPANQRPGSSAQRGA